METAEVPAAILAGGLATRLRPITESIPKALVEVGGRPFVDHQLLLLRRKGVRRVVFCLGYRGEQVQAHLGSEPHGLRADYSFDGPRLLGTAGALRRAAPLLADVFFVVYGDSYTDIDFGGALEAFLASGALGLMTLIHNEDRWDRSNVVFREGRLVLYDKRVRRPEMAHIDYGVAILRREALEGVPADGPAELSDLYASLVAEGRMIGFEVRTRFYEIGSPAGLAETEAYLSSLGKKKG